MNPINRNLEETGLELLLYQFSDKFNIEQIIRSYGNEIDKLNDDAYILVDNFNLNDATGVYLDYLGRLFGEVRDGDNDGDFRKRINARVLINNSKGTPNELLEILSQLTETENTKLWEHFPVSYIMYTDGNNATVKTLNALKKSSPITSEVALIVDTTQSGFVGTELLPNYKEKPTQHFLAELLTELDFLIDNVGDFIITDSGDNIVLFDATGDTVSYYGVFNEIL